jgi:integrase
VATNPERQPLSTDRQVRALNAGTKEYEHSITGTPGLRVRVTKRGKRVWYFRYRNRNSGKLEKLKIGEYRPDGMTLADARAEAERQRALANEHGSARQFRDADRADKRAALAARQTDDERDAYTVSVMIVEYLRGPAKALKSQVEVTRVLTKYIANSDLGGRPAYNVSRRDVIAILDELNHAGKLVQSNRVLAHFRRCCNWAITHEKLAANPCVMIERNSETPKERVLSDSEIRRFLERLPDSGLKDDVADIYRMVLLTGLRPGEAVRLAFPDIDEDEKTLTVRDTKNGRDHVIPTSDPVIQILERRRKAVDGQFLFPSPRVRLEPEHLRADSLPRPLRDALPQLELAPFTPHDLRRSFATGLARIGAPRLQISLALNHTVGGVTGIYDRHGYEREMREWLKKWADHVEALTAAQDAAKST